MRRAYLLKDRFSATMDRRVCLPHWFVAAWLLVWIYIVVRMAMENFWLVVIAIAVALLLSAALQAFAKYRYPELANKAPRKWTAKIAYNWNDLRSSRVGSLALRLTVTACLLANHL